MKDGGEGGGKKNINDWFEPGRRTHVVDSNDDEE